MYAPLHYREIDSEKSLSLKNSCGNFDSYMNFSDQAKADISWWKNNITSSFKKLQFPDITVVLYCDASFLGWGAVCGSTKTGGMWKFEEMHITSETGELIIIDINVLELHAIYLSLCALIKDTGVHIKVFSDNTTAVQTINKFGTSHSKLCHGFVKKIWIWAEEHRNFQLHTFLV